MPHIKLPADPAAQAQELYRLGRILEKAGEFPDHQWCQGSLARDRNGHPACANPELPNAWARRQSGEIIEPPEHTKPVSFCAIGLLQQAAAIRSGLTLENLKRCLETALPLNTPIPEWNDKPGRTPAEVRAAFQQAAARQYQRAAQLATAAAAPNSDQASPKPEPATAIPAAAG